MALSRGSRSLLAEAAGWLFAAVMGVVAVVFAPELRDLAYRITGLERPASPSVLASVRSDARPGEDATPLTRRSRHIELVARSNGHFLAEAEVNGRPIEVMVDTGASVIALTYDDAVAIGLAPQPRDFTHQVSTANGVSRVAPVKLDRVVIGDIVVRDVPAVITERGKLGITLLGNSFLSRISYRMANGRLILED